MKTKYNISHNPPLNMLMIIKTALSYFLVLLTCIVLSSSTSKGQNIGDYRSLNSGNWATASNWEVYNGTSWVTATTYPGQVGGSYQVTILAGDTITIPNTGITTAQMGQLTISGTLILNGGIIADVYFRLNTPYIYITPGLSPPACIIFIRKSLLILPDNAIIKVWARGLQGDCSHHQEIVIGTYRYAICHGAPGSILTFEELMAGGGSINSIITPASTNICVGSSVSLNGSYSGTIGSVPTYSWSSTGPQTLTFSPSNTAQNVTVTPTLNGTYSISLTVTTIFLGVPFSNTESFTLTVTKKSDNPTAATSAEDSIMLGTSTTLTLTGGGGGTNTVIRWYTNSCGGTLIGTGNNLSVSPTTTTTYYGRYEDGAPCNYNSGCAQTTIVVTPFINVWKGTISTNFGTAGNWLGNKVPRSGEDIFFDPTPLNDCILDSNRIIRNVVNGSVKNLNTSSRNLTINGIITFTGSGKIVATTTTGALTFAGTDYQSLNASVFSTGTIANLYSNNSKGVNLSGNLIISSKMTLTSGEFSIGSNTLTLNDSLKIISGSLSGGTTSNLIIGGTGFNITVPALTLNNLTLNRGNGLTAGGSFSIYGVLALTNGPLTLGPNTLAFLGSAPSVGSGFIDATNSLSKVIFSNPVSITLPASSFRGYVSNVTINGTGGIALGGNLTINKNLEFTLGKINTGTSVLIMTSVANNIIGANANAYINGNCRKIGKTAFKFEIGNNEVYAPIAISESAEGGSTSNAFTASYYGFNAHPTYDSTMHEPAIERVGSMEYWILDRSESNNVAVTLFWDSRSGGVSVLSDLLVIRWDGTQWVNHGNVSTTGNTSAGSITSEAVTKFSPFTLGSLNGFSNYLPITLLDFTAKCVEDKIQLDWSTASETNNNYFEIEKSPDAVNWKSFAIISGAGNSSVVNNYSYIDDDANEPESFYRLKSVDFDGTYYYSKIVYLNSCKKSTPDFSLFPTPTKGTIFLKFSGDEKKIEKLDIYNLIGEIIYSSNNLANEIDFSNQPEGSYYMIAYYGDKRIIKKFSIIK